MVNQNPRAALWKGKIFLIRAFRLIYYKNLKIWYNAFWMNNELKSIFPACYPAARLLVIKQLGGNFDEGYQFNA